VLSFANLQIACAGGLVQSETHNKGIGWWCCRSLTLALAESSGFSNDPDLKLTTAMGEKRTIRLFGRKESNNFNSLI
jgi:hypothetical protein